MKKYRNLPRTLFMKPGADMVFTQLRIQSYKLTIMIWISFVCVTRVMLCNFDKCDIMKYIIRGPY